MTKIKLLLADDHPLIRVGFKSLLGKSEQFDIVGEAGSGEELIALADTTLPDIILSDIKMPGLSGLDAMTRVLKVHPEVKFIILSMHEEREYIINAIRNGAAGYVLKNIERLELEKAILTVHEGGKYFSPVVANILADSLARPEQNETGEVTPREKEVLELVAQGFSTKQVADKLGIGVRTVESHRINMLKKMKVNNTAELIRKAIELKII